ncbi:hypothetical protein [Agromyces sp. SYSU T0242]|uniref:hypothetical protein n=1 Tax=Agromyces litoreus TaxID=3158561 RepID=UPI00339418BC
MSTAETSESGDERMRVADPTSTPGRSLGSIGLFAGVATVVLACLTPYRDAVASGVLALAALGVSTIGIVARRRARRAGLKTSSAAYAAIWLGLGAIAIIGISVLPALLMPTGTAG